MGWHQFSREIPHLVGLSAVIAAHMDWSFSCSCRASGNKFLTCLQWGQNGINGAQAGSPTLQLIVDLLRAVTPAMPLRRTCIFKLTLTLLTPVLIINWQWTPVIGSGYKSECNNGLYHQHRAAWLPNQRGSAFNFNWCTNWKTGSNEIIVHVKVTPGYPSQCQTCRLIGARLAWY